MNRVEFTALLQLQGKVINGDLIFVPDVAKAPLKRLRSVTVEGTGHWGIKLDGWYNPNFDSLSFTFSCAEADGKPICRVDVRGPEHDAGGRTHKHELRFELCPRRNLPTRVARRDLEYMTPHQVWTDLCIRAAIVHNGQFNDPR